MVYNSKYSDRGVEVEAEAVEADHFWLGGSGSKLFNFAGSGSKLFNFAGSGSEHFNFAGSGSERKLTASTSLLVAAPLIAFYMSE